MAFPSGISWSLYFHDTDQKKWALDTFTKICSVSSWEDFSKLYNTIDKNLWSNGMFFFMRDPIPPLWENFANIRGGNYSLRISIRNDNKSYNKSKDLIGNPGDIFLKYVIASILGEATSKSENILNGVSMTPKKGFVVIKVWNKDSTLYNNSNELKLLDKSIPAGEVIYSPFREKRM